MKSTSKLIDEQIERLRQCRRYLPDVVAKDIKSLQEEANVLDSNYAELQSVSAYLKRRIEDLETLTQKYPHPTGLLIWNLMVSTAIICLTAYILVKGY